MKKILFAILALAFTLPVSAQKRVINAHWCSLGTSITWYNNNVATACGGFTKGYQTRVMEKLGFTQFTNNGYNGGNLSTALNNVINADYYTIEHGINDWGQSVPVGTMNDYINNTGNGTFAATYRKLIDKIYATNSKAKIVMCTPRKGAGFKYNGGENYLPENCDDQKNGIYLKQYVDLIFEIAAYEGIPVADFYNTGVNSRNIYSLSLNDSRKGALLTHDGVHPNDDSYQMMANVLIDALERVLVD